MDSDTPPPIRTFLPMAFFLIIIGWGGLIFLFTNTLPTVGPRWLFFFLSVLALTGTSIPFVAYLNHRFTSVPPASGTAIVRQSLWVGVYIAALAWLQIGRVLTPTLAILLAVGLGLIEFLLRLSERSQWKP